jgi:predicted XRE-type DNA-binding protein
MAKMTVQEFADANGLDATVIADGMEVDVSEPVGAPRIRQHLRAVEASVVAELTDAQERVAYAREDLKSAEAMLQEEVRNALQDGLSAIRIGEVLGVSRARVYQLRDGKR